MALMQVKPERTRGTWRTSLLEDSLFPLLLDILVQLHDGELAVGAPALRARCELPVPLALCQIIKSHDIGI